MEPSPELDLERPPSASGPDMRHRAASALRTASDSTVLWLHRQADRFDLVPTEFGREAEVDPGDARSVAREWWRQARLWAAYNPEEMFALKVGAVAFGAALIGLVLLVGAVR
jgi:hypothetical protein